MLRFFFITSKIKNIRVKKIPKQDKVPEKVFNLNSFLLNLFQNVKFSSKLNFLRPEKKEFKLKSRCSLIKSFSVIILKKYPTFRLDCAVWSTVSIYLFLILIFANKLGQKHKTRKVIRVTLNFKIIRQLLINCMVEDIANAVEKTTIYGWFWQF